MGVFKKLLEKQKEHDENINKKNIKYIEEQLKIFRETTGFKKSGAKGRIFGSNKVNKILPAYNVDYLGGFIENMKEKNGLDIILIDEGLLIQQFAINDIIPIEEIKSIENKNETEISKDVTLARMAVFGLYSLAMKKEKKTVTNFTILNCERNGLKYTIIFSGKDSIKLYQDLFNVLTK